MFYFVGFVWFWEIYNGYSSKQKQKQKLKWVCGEGYSRGASVVQKTWCVETWKEREKERPKNKEKIHS